VILTVNDDRTLTRYSTVFRSGVARIRFYPIREAELSHRLTEVVRTEGLELAPGVIEAIVRKSRGDLRAAMNDLDAVAPLPTGRAQLEVLAPRDLTSDLELLTEEALSTPRFYRAGEVRDRIDAPPDDLFPWIEENIPHFSPDATHRDAAFSTLAAADLLLTRARRARVWGLWAYASELQTGGVSLQLHDRPVAGHRGAAFPQFLGEMGRTRGARTVREALAEKIGRRFHASHAKTRETLLPFLEGLAIGLKGGPRSSETARVMRAIVRELELTPEEVGYLLGVAPDSATVHDLLGRPGAPAEEQSAPTGTEAERDPGPTGARGGDSRKRVQRQLSDFPAR